MCAQHEQISHIHAKLHSKIPSVASEIPETALSLPVEANEKQLNDLILSLISPENLNLKQRFSFLVNGVLLNDSILDYLNRYSISLESEIDIECILKQEPPEISDSIAVNDWVSSLHLDSNLSLAGCFDNSVNLCTNAGNVVFRHSYHKAPVKCVKIVDCNHNSLKLLSGSTDCSLLLVPLDSSFNDDAFQKVEFVGHAASVEALAFYSNRFCSGSFDGILKIWALDFEIASSTDSLEEIGQSKRSKFSNLSRNPLVTLSEHSNCTTSLQWPSSESVLSTSLDGEIFSWDLNNLKVTNKIQSPKPILCSALSSSLIAAGCSDWLIRLFDTRSSRIVEQKLTNHSDVVSAVSWIDPNNLLSASFDSKIKLWDIRSPSQPLYDISTHEGKVLTAEFKNSIIASGGEDSCIRFCNYAK